MRIFLSIACLVLIAPAAPAAAQAPAELPLFDQTRLYTQAAFGQAIRPYQTAIAAAPTNARAHHWLGVAHLYAYRLFRLGVAPYAGGFLPQAIASLEEALRLDPAFLATYLALHDAYVLAGRLDRAAAIVAALGERTRPPSPP